MKTMRTQQRGAVLAISLIIMLVLTMVVLSSNRSVLMQEKMTTSVRDMHVALEDAEIGIRVAATVIDNLTGTGNFNTSGPYYSLNDGPTSVFDSENWTDAKTLNTTNSVTGNQVLYYLEDTGIIAVPEEDLSGVNMLGYGQTTGGGDVTAFRVVARATGQSGTAERIIVAYYGKRL